MSHIVDRRKSYNRNKNIANRKRFVDRYKKQIKESVNENIQQKNLKDLEKGKKIKVKVKDVSEPTFKPDSSSGESTQTHPGNTIFNKGDKIKRPQQGGQGQGSEGSLSDDTIEEFSFTLSKEEFYDIMFEDMELPDFIKKSFKKTEVKEYKRQGFQVDGNPSNLDLRRSMQGSIGRRMALGRPSKKKMEELEEKLLALLEDKTKNKKEILVLEEKLAKMKKKLRAIPFIDPIDVRYKRFERVDVPKAHAVMLCIMDVSGSMTENLKDLAKRFFLLLYMFLTRKYDSLEIRFIRHTTEADEVDEETFFYDRKSGGTQVSSALILANDIIDKDYDLETTNIYVAHASDSDNWGDDNKVCEEILREKFLEKIQYYAYIDVNDRGYSGYGDLYTQPENLSEVYDSLSKEYPNLVSKKIKDKTEIFKVFAELFKKKVSK